MEKHVLHRQNRYYNIFVFYHIIFLFLKMETKKAKVCPTFAKNSRKLLFLFNRSYNQAKIFLFSLAKFVIYFLIFDFLCRFFRQKAISLSFDHIARCFSIFLCDVCIFNYIHTCVCIAIFFLAFFPKSMLYHFFLCKI